MEIICIQGAAPGRIVATLSHGTAIRQVSMTVEKHAAGGWHVLQTDGSFGPRCHAVSTAVLLDASEAFAPETASDQKMVLAA
jgi:hypothetical protein